MAACLLVLPACTAPAAGEAAGFGSTADPAVVPLDPVLYLPDQPADRIADEAGLLTEKQKETLRPALAAAASRGVSLYVIALPHPPPVPSQEYFAQIFRTWQKGWIYGSIFYVEGVTVTPIVRVGGTGAQKLGGPFMEGATAHARKAAAQESNAGASITRCTLAFLEDLTRGTPADAAPEPAPLPAAQPPPPADSATPLTLPLIGTIQRPALFYSALIAPLVLLFLAALWLLSRRSRPLLFPAIEPRTRFAAPYSGGNNARISFLKKRRKTA